MIGRPCCELRSSSKPTRVRRSCRMLPKLPWWRWPCGLIRGMMMFTAVDVETANEDLSSICQIGIATAQDGAVSDVWNTLINPLGPFSPRHTAIHGIGNSIVVGAPSFGEIIEELENRLSISPAITVSHTAFDRISVTRACCQRELNVAWLDSVRIARRAWPERYAQRGYGLAAIARDLGIEFRHHDAGEDARVAAEIVLRASEKMCLSIEDWLIELGQRKASGVSRKYDETRRDDNKDDALFGEVLVFTGSLQIVRREATDIAATAGCIVHGTVTKETTLLVVGDQDINRLAGHEKSAKHRKAEALIEAGQPIRIVQESDFLRLCSIDGQVE
jgi:DNA polymerase III subunit epsilon